MKDSLREGWQDVFSDGKKSKRSKPTLDIEETKKRINDSYLKIPVFKAPDLLKPNKGKNNLTIGVLSNEVKRLSTEQNKKFRAKGLEEVAKK